MMCKRLLAEGIGTFWLVFAGCGAAVLAGAGVGTLGIALAFGLSVLTMGYAVGHISGAHLNPAVTIGLVVGKRFDSKEALGYIVAQVIGATFASWVLMQLAGGHAGFNLAASGLAANGYGEHSPGGYDMHAALLCEIVMTFFFVFIIMGATDVRSKVNFAPIAIGLTLALIHIVSIPITNTSVNPARATGPAIIMGGWALDQLWLFWLAPIIGGVLGAFSYRQVVECFCTGTSAATIAQKRRKGEAN